MLALSMAVSLLAPLSVSAVETPSMELGKRLFESVQLGSKGRSCESCHRQGKGLDKIGDFNEEELKDIINACIRDALGGKLLGVESQEMDSLYRYVRTFQQN
ncbi:MAG: cytochrome C [Desulfuromonas sp.]|nr:MAG: cytochrome C [Desulfuromonas sp.]